ncbi:MAG TPA: AMP-binding protein, partial [Candidatus Thermoplasmatota archaeon]|nr:AMP-binding protein [Candidatus Thermoplasmatota archaeon]
MPDPRPVHALAVDRHAEQRPQGGALLAVGADGSVRRWTFGGLAEASRRLARALREREGVRRGDRVVVLLPQRAEAALLHLALSRLGAIAVPLSPLFGPEGLATRMADAAPCLVLTHGLREGIAREALHLAGLTDQAPLRLVDTPEFERAWQATPPLPDAEHAPVGAEDPMWLVYTSGTTGRPKGALLPHRVLAGRMPGFRLAHEPFRPAEQRTLFYSPADWSWIGGLLDALFAPWHEGAEVLAHERTGHFDAAATYRMLAEHQVTNAFLPP